MDEVSGNTFAGAHAGFQPEIAQKHREQVKQGSKTKGCCLSAAELAVHGRTEPGRGGRDSGARGEGVSTTTKGRERALLAKALVEQAGLTQWEAAEVNGAKCGCGSQNSVAAARRSAGVPLRRKICKIESQLGNLLFKG